jgi:tetratricopeptide (TPR) repeat protein
MKILLALFFLVGLSAVYAKSKKEESIPLRKDMNSISGHIRKLAPFIASEAEFNKESNQKVIQKNLVELSALFKNIKNHQVMDRQGLAINRQIMSEQLKQTVNLFNAKKKSEARAKFQASLSLCISCHTQSPGIKDHKLITDVELEGFKLSDFEKADMYFVTRDFEKAIKLYDAFLKGSKKTDNDEFIFDAFERELIYYVKIKKSFPEAKSKLEELMKGNNFNEKVTQEVNDWLKALSGKSLWENFDAKIVSEDEMAKFMKQFIDDDEDGPIFSPTNSKRSSGKNEGIL